MSTDVCVKDKVSLLLPVYNEADTIEHVIEEFYEEVKNKIPSEIVVAEDGSTDGTKEILKNLRNRIPMKLILGDNRKGYTGGLKDGLEKVTGEYVLFSDSDGQHFASDFWKLYELRKDFDVISGWRVKRADPFHRKLMSGVFQRIARTFFDLPPLHDITAPFRLVRTDVAKMVSKEVKYMIESYWTEFTIRAYKMGASIMEIPVRHRNRPTGFTRVYKPSKIPTIAVSQFISLLKIWWELEKI